MGFADARIIRNAIRCEAIVVNSDGLFAHVPCDGNLGIMRVQIML